MILSDIRANIHYRKKNDEYQKITELILLSTKPCYKFVNDNVIKDLEVVETRLYLTEKAFEAFIEALTKIKDITENDLTIR
jgi:hypothetical protein